MQQYVDLKIVDVVILQGIENKLDEIFEYCNTHLLNIVVLVEKNCDYDLRIIAKRDPSSYFDIWGGDVNICLSWDHICKEGCERKFYEELCNFLLRLKSLEGVSGYIREITKAPDVAQNENEEFF